MAITKVYAVRNKLHRAVSYVANEEKTNLDHIIDYATNSDKTEQRLFECAINCSSVLSAYDEMQATKARWNKTDKVLAYHFIQSFKPGEVTPELAHKIGVTFAMECFGDRFEIVVGTHLDKQHLHNHVVINSVSFVDGGKYHSSPQSYYKIIRAISDKLCVEHILSVIEPKDKGKHYAEWKADQEVKPTIRSIIRQEVDEVIRDSYTFRTFIELLEQRGYSVKYGDNVKHIAIRPPNSVKYIRLKSLGENYTEDNIKLRLEAQRKGIQQLDTTDRKPPKRHTLAKSSIFKPKKIKGFAALYLRYMYMLGKVRKRKVPKKVSSLFREDILKFERYQRQFQFLHFNDIKTKTDLTNEKSKIVTSIDELIITRKNLYFQKKSANTKELKADIQAQLTSVNAQLCELRKNKKLCENIVNDMDIIFQKLHQSDEIIEKEKNIKEEENNEHKWRSSRFDG